MGHLGEESALGVACHLKFRDRLHLLRHIHKHAKKAENLRVTVLHGA